MMLAEKERKIITLPVSKTTQARSLAIAATNYLKSGNIVHLTCIGVATNYIATKAIIFIKASLATIGYNLIFTPIFYEFSIKEPTDGTAIKTGIRWILSLDDYNRCMVTSSYSKDNIQN